MEGEPFEDHEGDGRTESKGFCQKLTVISVFNA